MTRTVLSGIAALSLLGSAAVARADEPRFRPDIDRHAAQDGRGETADVRNARSSTQRPTVERFQPEHPTATMFKESHAAPPLRSEFQVRFEKDRESAALPRFASVQSNVLQDAATASLRANPTLKADTKLPFKSDVTNRVEMSHDGEESAGAVATKSGPSMNSGSSSRLAGIASLPIKSEIKMRLSEHGEDSL